MDLKLVLNLITCVCVLGLLALMIYLFFKGKLNSKAIDAVAGVLDALPADEGSPWLYTLLYYCRLAVRAVEQMVKAGQLSEDDEIRKEKAIEFVKEYAHAEGKELSAQDMVAIQSLIEVEVYSLDSLVLPDGVVKIPVPVDPVSPGSPEPSAPSDASDMLEADN